MDESEIEPKQKKLVTDRLNEINLKKLDSAQPINKSTVQNEIDIVIKLLERDQVDKEIGDILKTTFLWWKYTDEGFADKSEYEERLKATHFFLSPKTMDKLFVCIISRKNNSQVSFIKIKQICEELKLRNNLAKDKFHVKELMYGKSPSKENHFDHPLINFLEIRMEEKFNSIHDAFRAFDENGDNKVNDKEFEKGMLNLNPDFKRHDIRNAFDLLDENKNGILEYHQFWELFDSNNRRGDPVVTSLKTKNISSGSLDLVDDEVFFKGKSTKKIKYEPPVLYGISNSGMENPANQRLRRARQQDTVSGFGSKSSRTLEFLGKRDDNYSSIEDIVSQSSRMRQKMNLPTPKNKNPEMFINDISSSGRKRRKSIVYKRNNNLTSNRIYGHTNKKLPNMTDIINHEYMNTFTSRLEQKTNKMRQESQAKIRQLKNYEDYKVNNTYIKRNIEIAVSMHT
jgi:hypothetical protein